MDSIHISALHTISQDSEIFLNRILWQLITILYSNLLEAILSSLQNLYDFLYLIDQVFLCFIYSTNMFTF